MMHAALLLLLLLKAGGLHRLDMMHAGQLLLRLLLKAGASALFVYVDFNLRGAGALSTWRDLALPHSGWPSAALEATQGQMDGFFSQLPYKCHLEEVATLGD